MLFTVLMGVFALGNLCSGSDLDVIVLEKLRDLESRLGEQEQMNAKQQQMIQQQQQQLDKQQSIIDHQQQQISRLEAENNKQKEDVANLENKITMQDPDRCPDCQKEASSNSSKQLRHVGNVLPSIRVSRQVERVAFTAFLDHTLEHLGIDHPIVYNRVLLNEGSAYKETSGMFTCPLSGLYVFYFSVSTSGDRQAVVKLVVDGLNQVDAISDTYHDNQEAQGANLAILSLRQGQQVWVANYRWPDKSIQDDNNNRFSSFSGFLLY